MKCEIDSDRLEHQSEFLISCFISHVLFMFHPVTCQEWFLVGSVVDCQPDLTECSDVHA